MAINEYVARRGILHSTMPNSSVLVMFSGTAPSKSADEQYLYTVPRNFYYLTGLARERFIYLAEKNNDQIQELIFIEKPDPAKEKWTGYRMREEAVRAVSGIEKVVYEEDFATFVNRLLLQGNYAEVYMDLESRDIEGPLSHSQQYAQQLHMHHPYLAIRNAYPVIANMRRIKSDQEVQLLKKAIAITADGLTNLWNNARPGMTEYQLEAHFNFSLKMAGVTDFAFPSIVASGANATILHYVENNRDAQDGELVLLDLGAQFGYYAADISRTFPINGKFSPRQKELYEIVLKTQLAVIDAIKPGFPMKELNEIAKKVLTEELLRIGLIADASELGNYYYHRVSHFLGLDTHDVGVYDGELQPGMVITVEPGLYVANEQIGIRIEDDVLVTEAGAEVLSHAIPKQVADIEAVMASGLN